MPFDQQQVGIAYEIKRITPDKNLEELAAFYNEAKTKPEKYDLNDAENNLNNAGYEFLNGGHNREAIKIFNLIVKEFPSSSNAWDSLGEAYAKSGDRKQAIASYQKCLELNPQSNNAKSWLEKLQKAQ
jgi:tetratricopeptide (TPR) repeat protein